MSDRRSVVLEDARTGDIHQRRTHCVGGPAAAIPQEETVPARMLGGSCDLDEGSWFSEIRYRDSVTHESSLAAGCDRGGLPSYEPGLLVSSGAVDRLAQEIGVANVTGILFDHVDQDPAQTPMLTLVISRR